MKKLSITGYILSMAAILVISSCGGKNTPGREYMPDMGYSRAYETYAVHDSTLFITNPAKRGGNTIFYNSMPVNGTIKRGELYPYAISGDTTGYKLSASIQSPIDSMSASDMVEAGRLYNINCGICHGDKGAGNGPVATKVAGVANLTLPNYIAMSEGTMFHVVTYGKGVMGSYASQLNREQRWKVVKYVKSLQGGGTAGKDSSATTGADSAVAKKG